MTKTKETTSEANPTEEVILTVAVSSRALFNFEKEHEIYKKEGVENYIHLQDELLKKNKLPKTGVAFPLVKKLLKINEGQEKRLVEIIVVSRNDPITGLRTFKAINANELAIARGCFTGGAPTNHYLKHFGVSLFISANAEDVREALQNGIPAAHVLPQATSDKTDEQIRIAFDGDSVLFSDEAERIFQTQGLEKFTEHEITHKNKPLPPGPIQPFFDAIHQLQLHSTIDIRTAIITARGGYTYERAINTLRQWNMKVDEAFFLNGTDKHDIIQQFAPDFYFDDRTSHLKGIVTGGHVDSGVLNE